VRNAAILFVLVPELLLSAEAAYGAGPTFLRDVAPILQKLGLE